MIQELRRIVEESEIIRYVILLTERESDAKWPRKNIVGRQELEIRLGKEHISFEVNLLDLYRHPKSGLSSKFRKATIRRAYV